MNRNLLLATTAVAGVAAFGAAQAQTTIYGGGSTLAANEYIRTIDTIGATTGFYDTATASGNLGATGQTGNVLYTGDGSGSGQKAFLLQDETVHVPGSTQTSVHFGASDAYLSQAQIDCYNAGYASNALTSGGCAAAGYTVTSAFTGVLANGGPIIQLPAFGTPIAIAYTAKFSKALTLQNSDLCGIFSGLITDWAQIVGAPGVTKSTTIQGAINVVVRSDGSGSTFLLTQHLSKVCSTGSAGNSAIAFTTTKTFSTLFSGGTMPSNFVGKSGSQAVADQLYAANGVGYLTPDYTSIALSSVPNSTAGSSINSWTPYAKSHYQLIQTAKVYNDNQGKAYAPNAGGTTLALKNPNQGKGDTIAQVPSSLSAAQIPANWVPIVSDPLQGYPIVGYTTLEFATCYANTAVATEISAWLTQLYGSGNKTNLTKEGFVAAPAGYGADILKAITSNKLGLGLNINNSAVCNTSGRPNTYAGLN
jgi:ABC-type phosphate transport system substrate-binding protein